MKAFDHWTIRRRGRAASTLAMGTALATAAMASGRARAQPPAAYAACAACHNGDPAAMGPSLVGVVGRPAGSAPGYHYSGPMKRSGVTWTAGRLSAFIKTPQAVVPGTTMPFGGLPDAKAAAEIVDYLKTLK